MACAPKLVVNGAKPYDEHLDELRREGMIQ